MSIIKYLPWHFSQNYNIIWSFFLDTAFDKEIIRSGIKSVPLPPHNCLYHRPVVYPLCIAYFAKQQEQPLTSFDIAKNRVPVRVLIVISVHDFWKTTDPLIIKCVIVLLFAECENKLKLTHAFTLRVQGLSVSTLHFVSYIALKQHTVTRSSSVVYENLNS